MPTPTFPSSLPPSPGTTKRVEHRTLQVDFGYGYTQRAGDGINSRREVWDVVWENYSDTDCDTIETFLDARGGHEVFNWTPPRQASARKFTLVGEHKRTPVGYDSSTITATFREEFDL